MVRGILHGVRPWALALCTLSAALGSHPSSSLKAGCSLGLSSTLSCFIYLNPPTGKDGWCYPQSTSGETEAQMWTSMGPEPTAHHPWAHALALALTVPRHPPGPPGQEVSPWPSCWVSWISRQRTRRLRAWRPPLALWALLLSARS